jgi:integrase
MCLYLTKRGATYYFRRAIPDELQPAFEGAREFTFSLRTKDKEEAKRRRSQEALRTDRLLGEARARVGAPAASRHVPPATTRAFNKSELEQDELAKQDEAERQARFDEPERADLRRRLEAALEKSTAELESWEAAARDVLRAREYDLTIEQERQLARRVERSEVKRGIIPVPASPTAPDGPQSAHAAAEGDGSGVMLDTHIIDGWASERKVTAKGKDAHRAVARWFYERVGRKPVDQITRKDVLAFKAKLIEEGQTAANIKMKLSRLRTILQWAADNDYAETNVAAGVKIKDTDAAKNKRKEFDLVSLNAIFSSPVFTEGERPAGGKGEAAYWLPLLALFTGARLEELGQLRTSDVVEEHYPNAEGADRPAWLIRITDDEADDLKIKNALSERKVPVHPELVRLGFIAYVEAANAAGEARLFPKLKADKYGRLTAKWGEWFSLYRRTVCGVTDKRMVFHSFRHTFKHYARHAGMIEGVQRQIMGHSPGDVADEYGGGYSLHQLVEGMKLYKVPGLKIEG